VRKLRQLSITSECSNVGVIKLVGVLITLESISNTRLQQQLIAELSQVTSIVVLERRCFLLQLICLLKNEAIATTLQQALSLNTILLQMQTCPRLEIISLTAMFGLSKVTGGGG